MSKDKTIGDNSANINPVQQKIVEITGREAAKGFIKYMKSGMQAPKEKLKEISVFSSEQFVLGFMHESPTNICGGCDEDNIGCHKEFKTSEMVFQDVTNGGECGPITWDHYLCKDCIESHK
jgi:hypothetical protein